MYWIGIAFLSFLVRWGYFSQVESPIMGGDSPRYLEAAESFAQGGVGGIAEHPLHQFYSLLLAPAYYWHIDVNFYITVFHILLSVGTVLLLYQIACELVDPMHAKWVGLAAAFYPSFLFWMRYVLTETLFLFVFCLFILCYLHFLIRTSMRNGFLLLGTSLMLFFSRPISVVILPSAATVLGGLAIQKRWGGNLRRIISGILFFEILALLFLCFQIASRPQLRQRVLSDETIFNFVNLAARLDSNNFEDYFRAISGRKKVMSALPQSMTEVEKRELTSLNALHHIFSQPGFYLKGCVKRFISFWLPGVYQGKWSSAHLILDSLFFILLMAGSIGFLFSFPKARLEGIALLCLVLPLALLAALTHMDTDGRCRVPAELVLLILSPCWYAYWAMPLFANLRWAQRAHEYRTH